MRTFIFACVHSAGRSQMSAAFADPELARGISAETQPAEHIHPVVVHAMRVVDCDRCLCRAAGSLVSRPVLS